jgi:capsular exopolysaccharide synthesis family protein
MKIIPTRLEGELIRYTEVISPSDTHAPPLPDPRRSLHDLIQTVWRWRRPFCLVFLGIFSLGVLALLVMPIKYTAQAMVMIGAHEPNALVPETPNAGAQQRELDVDGAIDVMTSPLSIRHVIEQLDLQHRPEFEKIAQDAKPNIIVRLRSLFDADESPTDPVAAISDNLERHLKVQRNGRSSFVTIKYTAANPRLATDIANAIATNTAADEAFQHNLTVTERAGFELLRVWPVSPATVPATPSSPNILLVLAATVGGGLCAALSVVFFADYQATRKVINAEQVARHGVRALAFIPAFSSGERRTAVRIVSESPHEAFSDSIASLRASLLRLTPNELSSCLVLLFTSALPFEGKSTTAAALATSIATSGRRVLLIDADLRSPTLHRVFRANSSAGLTSLEDRNKTSLNQLVQIDPDSGVHLLPAGAHNARPIDVLTSAELTNAINTWRSSFDYILIDAPPVLVTPDAMALIPVTDYCVVVARWGKTAWEAIGHALLMLTDAGAKIAGLAVSQVDTRRLGSPYRGRY